MENLKIGVLTSNDPPTSEFPIWKDRYGFFKCMRCKFKSKSLVETKIHYSSKHPRYI